MKLDQVLKKRRMIRLFRPEPVEGEKIWRIIRNAHRAPSAGHLEPQEYIVVTDPAIKQRLAEAAFGQMFIAEAPVVITVCADSRRNVRRYGERGREFYCTIDGTFASMLILLTAVDEGLGAAFIGAFDDDEVADVMGLPDGVRPIGVIPIGYSDEQPERLGRRPLVEKVHFDQWRTRAGTLAELKARLA